MKQRLAPLLAILSLTHLAGQEKKTDPKAEPKAVLTLPLSINLGQKSKVVVRGSGLDGMTKATVAGIEAKVTGNWGAPPAGNDLLQKKLGDRLLDLEVTLPNAIPPGVASIVLSGPNATTSIPLEITPAGQTLAEGEPNDGFAEAQRAGVGQSIVGIVQANKDVDTYRFEPGADRDFWVEVRANQAGSALDPFLAVYDHRGQVLEGNDDDGENRDTRLRVRLRTGDPFYVCIVDANDLGGPAHAYRLRVTPAPKSAPAKPGS